MDNLPLEGKSILVPRSEKQAQSITSKIKQMGGIPVVIPLIEFKEKKVENSLLQKVKKSFYHWIIFTSSNGVHSLMHQLGGQRWAHTVKIAAIGRKTQQSLEDFGYSVSFTPSEYVAETFVTEFLKMVDRQENILIIKGNLARDFISEQLKEASNYVDEATVYETYFPKDNTNMLVHALKEKKLDILLFTSSSTVKHFMKIVDENNIRNMIKKLLIVSIGPITTKSLREYGVQAQVMPTNYTVDDMLQVLVQYVTKLNSNQIK